MTSKNFVIIIESTEKNKNEIEKATEAFMKILDANNAKVTIAYQGSKKEVITEIESVIDKLK
jgi:hypothetical protein